MCLMGRMVLGVMSSGAVHCLWDGEPTSGGGIDDFKRVIKAK